MSIQLGAASTSQDIQRFQIDNIILVYDTKATFDTYRKESERLLLWSTTELRKPLSSLTHEDLLLYRRFLADPQPTQRWA